jgi:hypothetical protein
MSKYIIFFVLLTNIGCLNNSYKTQDYLRKPRILYYPKNNLVAFYDFKDEDSLPDTLLNYSFKSVIIECPNLNLYDNILNRIRPADLILLRINQYNTKNEFSENLTKFRKLTNFSVSGNNLFQCNFKGRVITPLKNVMVAGPYLMFPKFDSSLLFVNELNYAGIDTIIPKWVENLKYANSVTFNSKRIMEIKCDICLMNELQLLDISFSDLYVDEINHF